VAEALGKSTGIHMEIDGRIFDISKSKKSKVPYSSQKSIESSFKQDEVIELDDLDEPIEEGAEVQETEINCYEVNLLIYILKTLSIARFQKLRAYSLMARTLAIHVIGAGSITPGSKFLF
jgi:hypothetical protein